MIQKIKLQLSSVLSARICLLVAMLAKIGLLRVFLNIGTDKAALLVTTKNFLAGHGISIGRTFFTDLADKTYMAYIGWPPGYSLLLSPFLILFPQNFMLATFCLDMLAAIMFFIYLQKILCQLGFSTLHSNLFLLFQGFILHEYIISSHPTDFIAMSFVVAGWYYCNSLFFNRQKWLNQVLCVFFFGIATLIRYQFMPVCVLSVIWIFYTGWKHQNDRLKKTALFIALSLIIITGLTLLYQKQVSGVYLYQIPLMTKGWYPENIIQANPFAIQSFLELDFAAVQLSLITGIRYEFWWVVFKLLAIPVLIYLCYSCWKWLAWKKSKNFSTAHTAWATGALLSIGIIFILFLLSVTNSLLPGRIPWTFVKDGRYFAFVIIYVQLFIWKKAFANIGSKKISLLPQIALVALFSFYALHGAYVLLKKTPQQVLAFKSILPAQPEIKMMLDFVTEKRQNHPEKIICVAGFNKLGYFADWYGVNALFLDNGNLIPSVQSSKPVTLLVIIHKNDSELYSYFTIRPGVSLYKEDKDWVAYSIEISTEKK